MWRLTVVATLLVARAGFGSEVPRIAPGAVELGIAGSLVSIEGATRATLALRAGSFVALGPGLAGLEIEPAWLHVSELDGLEVQALLSWQPSTRPWADRFFAGLAGGVREEWLGSFRETRYPVGANLGIRFLLDARAGFRAEYRLRRVLDDPAGAFTEHHMILGLSIFLRNPAAPR